MGRNEKFTTLVGFFLAIFLSHQTTYGTDLMLQVDPGREECFYQVTEFNNTLYVDYSVVSTNQGELDINFQISDAERRPIITEFRKPESRHEVPITNGGIYRICFDNTFSHFSHKTVAFHISIEAADAPQWKDYDQGNFLPDGNYEVTVEDIKSSIERVHLALNKVEGVQDQFRLLELKDRSIAESNFERVNFWSMVYMIVLMVVGVLQVMLLKSLFDDKYSVRKYMKMKG